MTTEERQQLEHHADKVVATITRLLVTKQCAGAGNIYIFLFIAREHQTIEMQICKSQLRGDVLKISSSRAWASGQ